MKVFIFGNQGNMGKRYEAVLKYLGHQVEGIDKQRDVVIPDLKKFDGIIVATPTDNHLQTLWNLYDREVEAPILCEKPFINSPLDMDDLQKLLRKFRRTKMKVSMVSQYDQLLKLSEGETVYNYFRHGNDGIAWDCINIIHHAYGKISLREDSPIWTCIINGHKLNQSEMDMAYVKMMKNWLENPYVDQYDRILSAHQKVVDYLNGKFD